MPTPQLMSDISNLGLNLEVSEYPWPSRGFTILAELKGEILMSSAASSRASKVEVLSSHASMTSHTSVKERLKIDQIENVFSKIFL